VFLGGQAQLDLALNVYRQLFSACVLFLSSHRTRFILCG
jgi:hypothetical protein